MSKEYTANEIRTIDELIDHIRENIGMYIGDSTTPEHLFEECFTNSIDEALAGYANEIKIKVDTENNIYEVIDNGRGIPIENDVPVQISTKFSGAKFKGSKTAYDKVSGLHGVGLVVVNALSTNYEIEIYRSNKYALFQFENGKLVNRKVKKCSKKKPFSTRVSFIPDESFFDNEMILVDTIRNRCLTSSVELPNCNIWFQEGDNEEEQISYDIYDYFNNYCTYNDDEMNKEIIHINQNSGGEKFEVLISWSDSGPISPKILSAVNVLPVEDGGTHINLFNEVIKEVIADKAKKNNYNFQPSDALVRLRAYLSLHLIYPQFGAQSKDKLTNRKNYFNDLRRKFKRSFENYLNNNKEFLFELLDEFQRYRRSLSSRKLRSTSSNRASTKLTKLKDCQRRDGELLITEGDSAAGNLTSRRDPQIHAILPLRGKIPSISNKTEDIINNTEISDLISAIGTGYGPEFNINNIRYSKIIIFTDADPDGGHIAALLMAMFCVLMPGIIQNGYLYLAQTPLRAVNNPKNKEFVPLWTKEQYDKAVKDKKPITYFKGLGELNDWQLEECGLNEENRRLIQITYPQNVDNLLEYFLNVEKRRQLLSDESIGFFNY